MGHFVSHVSRSYEQCTYSLHSSAPARRKKPIYTSREGIEVRQYVSDEFAQIRRSGIQTTRRVLDSFLDIL